MTLRVTGLAKSFGGVHALRGVDLTIESGEIHALLGHNGAGKSTLIKALGGAFSPDRGTIEVAGHTYDALSPRRSIDAGIAIIFQHLSLVDSLSVVDNIFLGQEQHRAGVVTRANQRAEARRLLDRLGANVSVDARVANLPMGQRQLVEIAKAMSRNPAVLVLDEPTAALSVHEIQALERTVLGLRADGLAICYVTHLLGEVERLADRMTVLRDGQVHVSTPLAGKSRRDIIEAIAEPSSGLPERAPILDADPPQLQLRGLTGPGIGPIDLDVRPGEIVGLYGLIGSGRTRTIETVFGRYRRQGTVSVGGRTVTRRGPRAALAAGLALVPGDRGRQGLFASLSALDNALLPAQRTLSRFGVRNRRRELETFRSLTDALGVRPSSAVAPARAFSGGNQQKLLLGRWINGVLPTTVLMLDEPTQGVDVNARHEIYRVVQAIASERRAAVLFASTDPEEVVTLADRCLVMDQGRVIAAIAGPDLTEDALLAAVHRPTPTEVPS
ncbi:MULTISPECIES: sugar ABC transporter ATP-binding protein [unclassified Nocardioides]|uniref:sugar ABC transporter ATP-binding protein n=1 Tax=unclassified Nocardioides TaxID=2615069 RepID=UPI0007032F0C|nr:MULTISPECIES: sugar ABC transporter ATP-binding protein [unclassified Nocardioides]KRC59717.1 ABC transporter ATP-binding protein [Nocardioides sp. Root79]KRC68458.1 ABC transporter ATP-binding protein [Nocardioides sp. Root240]